MAARRQHTPAEAEEIARLTIDQARERRRDRKHRRSSNGERVAATAEVATFHPHADPNLIQSLNVATAAPTERRARKFGRRPKVRTGTERLSFGRSAADESPLILHVGSYTTDTGPVNIDGTPAKPPTDWADVAAVVVSGAKLSVLSYLDGIRDLPEHQRRGVPDPRGPTLKHGEALLISESGVSIARGHSSEFAGRGEAVPAVMLSRIRSRSSTPLPAWFLAPVREPAKPTGEPIGLPILRLLLELASGGRSGGAGLLSTARIAALLRDPPALSRLLMKQAGTDRAGKSLAAQLPRR